MKHTSRRGLAVGIFCFLMLVSIPITSGLNIRVSDISRQNVIDDEQGLQFFWLTGCLKNVTIYENETLEMTVYEGTVVNGGGIVWIPKLSLLPLPALLQKGDTFQIYIGFPEFHTRILRLPNNQILFSERFFGLIYIDEPEDTPLAIEYPV